MDARWKLISAGSMALAGMLAGQIVEVGWKRFTGEGIPVDPEDPGVSVTELIVFATLSGALMGLARQLAALGAKRYYAGPRPKRLE